MTVNLSYESDFSRVRIAATSLGTAPVARVERSLNGVTWTTVRGGSAVPVTAGTMQTLDDYEFAPNVPNWYRVTRVNTVTFVATGAGVTGNNTSVTPSIPTGSVAGDLLLIHASIRNSPDGTPNTPAGYTLLVNGTNHRIFGKIHTGTESNPTVSFADGVANADTLAQMATFRNAQLSPTALRVQLNNPQQNITRPNPAVVVAQDYSLVLHAVWKQDDITTITAGQAGFTLLGLQSSTAGDDAAQSWSYWVQTARVAIQTADAQVTGGTSAISRSLSAVFLPTTTSESATITPMITDVWLKSISRPFLNRVIDCVALASGFSRKARNGIFPVIGRSDPIAITDVRLSAEFVLRVTTRTRAERDEFDLILASGDPFYLQTPPDNRIPTTYLVVNDTLENVPLRSRDCDVDYRTFNLPVVRCAAPAADVVGAFGTWQTVVNTYATWADVLANHPTWADLLELAGSPGEVIVP